MNKKDIGSLIKQQREYKGLSKTDLANKAGISRRQQVTEIEDNVLDYGISALIKLLQALDCELIIQGVERRDEENEEEFKIDFSNIKPVKK